MSNTRLAYLLLILTTFFWAGNFVLARAVHASVPPIGLAFWRWFAVAVFIVPWAWKDLKQQWPVMRAHPWLMLTFGVFSVGAFNTLVYIGLQTTTAVNALLLLSAGPVFIMLLSAIILGHGLKAVQVVGLTISAAGVLMVLTHGDLSNLAGFENNAGVLWVLGGVISWALYSVLLHKKPSGIGGQGFFAMTVIIGVIGLLPFYLMETFVQNRPVHIDMNLVLTVAYVAIFASILAYLFWNKAVELIGANRSSPFIHLIPAFGLVLSVLFIGEQITTSGFVGLALIFAGLVVAAGKFGLGKQG
ncbi:DMT family transporter [Hydrogenovibrio kuenenii]|uniref:DMT family transporter n=1 Tax=Hydrogenovibrio kuenenii TaxID=63658 RepID=UPI000464479A|nr:DMT family transporter [Hydrogenovibrio kuenenii]